MSRDGTIDEMDASANPGLRQFEDGSLVGPIPL